MPRHLRTALLALCLATPAFAQDGSEAVTARTPESAQKFLTTVQTVGVLASWEKAHTNFFGSAKSIRSTEPCVTIATGVENGAERDFTIDWSTVEDVGQGADRNGVPSVIMFFGERQIRTITLTYGTTAMRDRAKAAAVYLKSACDKTASTGF